MDSFWYKLSPAEVSAIFLSIKVALWAVGLSLPPALGLGWLLARKEFLFKGLLDALLHLPMVMPPVVVGYGLLLLCGNRGPLGPLLQTIGFPLAFHWRGAALAAAVVSFPLMINAIRLSIEAIDLELEEAARSLGAKPWRVYLSITLPLSLPGILTGGILAFARSLGEFGATITFVSNIPGETRTLPLALFNAAQVPGGDALALRLAVISILLSLAALMGARSLSTRSLASRRRH